MKSISKLLIDIGPLAVFFIFYTRSDLKSAILPFMIATIIEYIITDIGEYAKNELDNHKQITIEHLEKGLENSAWSELLS